MNTVKQILAYLIWIVLALLLGIGHMRIVLGAKKDSSTTLLDRMFGLIYDFGLIHIGLRIGGVIAFLFIILDVFYLKKKLKNNIKATGIRFLLLIGIAMLVGVSHYILEKKIDII